MPRCEACHGTIRTKRAMTHDQVPCFAISRFEFDADVGWSRAKKTYFCTRECAVEGLEEEMLLDPDDVTFHAMRHDYEPGEAAPDVGTLLERAQELLIKARDQLDRDDDAWKCVQGQRHRLSRRGCSSTGLRYWRRVLPMPSEDDDLACDYCDGTALVYELRSDKVPVNRCIPCLAIEQGQQQISMSFDRFVDFEADGVVYDSDEELRESQKNSFEVCQS